VIYLLNSSSALLFATKALVFILGKYFVILF
jgi:hypothetical protein